MMNVNFALSADAAERLERLKIKTEATTNAEVIRNALRLYEALIEETESGGELYVKKQNKMTRYKVFL